MPPEIIVTEQIGVDLKLDVPVTDDDGRTRLSKRFLPTVDLDWYRFIMAARSAYGDHQPIYEPSKTCRISQVSDMSVLAFSIDPRKNQNLRGKRRLRISRHPTVGTGWHFLTAPPPSVRAVTKAITLLPL